MTERIRPYIWLVIISIVTIIMTVVIRDAVLDNAKVITLSPNQISWLTAQTMAQNASSTYVPIEGVDYTLKTTTLDSGAWVIVTTQPINGSSDPQTIVYKQSGGTYVVALGPSNTFNPAALNGLPSEVSSELNSLGVVHGGLK